MSNVQLATGGWNAYPPYNDSEDNEITGEALWAYGVVPEPASVVLLGLGVTAGALLVRRGW